MKRKLLSVLLLSATALGLLTGCQQGSGKLYDPDHPVSITVWTYYNGDQLESFNRLVDEFNDTVGKEKGIFLESFSQGTVIDLETNVLAAAEGKVGASEMPNIFAAYADTAYKLDEMGYVVDLQDYFSEKELDAYIDSYIDEGHFSDKNSIKIFPTAKSTEIFLINKTDWDKFAKAENVSYDNLKTMEGLVEVSEKYYNWTDSLTPEPDDGKAFFGRDAMANYFFIGAMQLGTELFQVEDSHMTLNFDKETIRKLWDCYYVPYVKGYFASSGRFRSDDVKLGNILSFVGSSSGATFFPDQVIINDTESYPIEVDVLPAPQFENGENYAVQQGAGMVVTTGSDAQIQASVEFLKWFTAPERNITFSIGSGYLPVTKEANDMDTILKSDLEIDGVMEDILNTAVDTVNENTLYTPKAFLNGTSGRSILESCLSDQAAADREIVVQRIAQGQSMQEAASEFLTDSYFDTWYESVYEQLQALEDK